MQSLLFGDLVLIHERSMPERLLADIERTGSTGSIWCRRISCRLLRLPDA
jgi:hypothetical protein